MFYYAGLAFDRPTSSTSASSFSSIFVARYNDLNNNENLDPITYIDTHLVATGNSSQFLDKPSLAVDIPRSGAATVRSPQANREREQTEGILRSSNPSRLATCTLRIPIFLRQPRPILRQRI